MKILSGRGQMANTKYHLIDIEDNDDANDRTSSSKKRHVSRVCFCIKPCACVLVCLDWFVSGALELMLCVYRAIAGRYPLFLANYERWVEEEVERLKNEKFELKQKANNDLGSLHDKIKTQEENISHLQSTLNIELQKNNSIKKEKDSLYGRLQSLTKEKNALENEKEDALRRLSELVSVRLRDNNPNIVDLNDQCRPTKLAEMFSELYDNEWTSAFTALEGLGEEYAIVILLNIVTKAYGVCGERVAEPWEVLTEWFLDMNIPGAQQASKWLKDSRKANIKNKIPEVEKEYEAMLLTTYKETDVAKALSGQDMKCYITKCIELCLLMVTTDPPVVLKCPGWTTEIKKHEKDRNVQQLSRDETLARGSKRERELFDKDLFKEYTTRGQYLDYVVWPALFLHEDGPMLSKGIAQGSSEKYRDSMENI
ncbi:uncharacterized protein LOC128556960 isoform X2 [Mercenaria mercenaria]|uniref:uncharacterized protein LOC128556960 isoform X2 n=1 Tax=Mercenaria mercenaria TaxID=6596 RepID=UPI00234FB5B4|nr:uncharacterized protein LOC128556960 isoform X2 [Mercenaria mercenaria]